MRSSIRNRFLGAWDLTGVRFQEKEGQEEQKNFHMCLSFNRLNKLFMEREHLGYESSWTEYFFPYPCPLNALKKTRIRGVIGDGPYSCSDFSEKSLGENEELWEIYKSIESSFREANDRLAENEAWYLSLVAYQQNQYSDVEDWISWIALEYWAF